MTAQPRGGKGSRPYLNGGDPIPSQAAKQTVREGSPFQAAYVDDWAKQRNLCGAASVPCPEAAAASLDERPTSRAAVARPIPSTTMPKSLVIRTAGVDRHHHVVPDRAQRVRLRRAELDRRINGKVSFEHELTAYQSRELRRLFATARLHLRCSAPWYRNGSPSTWPRSTGSSGSIGRPHRAHKTPPPATFRAQPFRNALCLAPYLSNVTPSQSPDDSTAHLD